MGKLTKIFTLFLISCSLHAKSFLLSPLPLPPAEILDIEIDRCDQECLLSLLKSGEVFSFLAKAPKVQDETIRENYQLLASLLNIAPSFVYTHKLKIAMLLPTKKIGKYAQSSTKSVISYLLAKNAKFYLKSFEIEDEEYLTIQSILSKLESENFDFVIAPLTLEGAKNLASIPTFLSIYVPTVNKNDINNLQNSNLIFGGIDYKDQIDELLDFANEKIVIFYEIESPLAHKLTTIIENESNKSIVKKIKLKDQVANLKRYFYKNQELNSSTIFLNTPIVKSSLIMSQLTLYNLEPKNILSTQINYNPLIFSLTQYKDRKNLILANSINGGSNYLEEINSLLNNDIVYNWINYSVSIGIDYFYAKKSKDKRVFTEELINNQVIYNVYLEKALLGSFKTLERNFEIDQETLSE